MYQDNEIDEFGIIRGEKRAGDEKDRALRPQLLKDFQGQENIKENLSVFIQAARSRGESLDHLFLIGPPGLGKTTLAQITAQELGVECKITGAPALDKPKDLAGILTTLSERSVFFIDEIHRLKPAIEEMLYIAMEDYELDWIIGQGPGARTVRIPLPPFTLIGATTRAGMVSSPLISRFGIVQRFEFYSDEELASIIMRSADILQINIEKKGCYFACPLFPRNAPCCQPAAEADAGLCVYRRKRYRPRSNRRARAGKAAYRPARFGKL